MMDGGQLRDGYSEWMVDGNGWHDGDSIVIDLTAKDSNGRHEGNLPTIEGLTVMKGDGWRWMFT